MHRREDVGEVLGCFLRLDEPTGGAHREDLDEREPRARQLRLERAHDHLLGARDVAGVVDRATRDVGRAVELGDEVADADREAVLGGVTAVERVLGALTERGGGGHVPAGLAEHAVVHHEAGDVLTPCRGVQHLLQALVHHVAVALDGDDERVGLGPLHAGGERRRPAVQRLEHLDVEVVGERRVAPDAEDGDGALHRVDLFDGLEDRPHGDGLAAAGAQLVLADVDERGLEVVDQPRRLGRRPVGGRNRSELIEHPLDATARYRGVEIGRDAESGTVEAQPADEVHRRAAEHREPHVVDHLALVVLVDRDRTRALRRARDELRREREQRDGPDEPDARRRRASS